MHTIINNQLKNVQFFNSSELDELLKFALDNHYHKAVTAVEHEKLRRKRLAKLMSCSVTTWERNYI